MFPTPLVGEFDVSHGQVSKPRCHPQNDDESIKLFLEYIFHQTHKCGWGISRSKWHNRELVVIISTLKRLSWSHSPPWYVIDDTPSRDRSLRTLLLLVIGQTDHQYVVGDNDSL